MWMLYTSFESDSFGYGYRSSGFRDVRTREEYKKSMERFFASMKDYSASMDNEDVRIIGDVGFTCGNYTEKITEKDDTVRYVKARGTSTWMKINGKWKLLLYHRDAQYNNP
jgi:ketosteroid isomerase-like protein